MRTISYLSCLNLVYFTDEEITGPMGMKAFLQSEDFKKLNVGFCFDEGIASADETFPVFYAERSLWREHYQFTNIFLLKFSILLPLDVHFLISGTAGHGSLLHKNTVGEKLNYILNKLFEFRQHEVDRLDRDKSLLLGDVTTINLTVVKGGVQSNVVPPVIEAVFDMRLALNVDHDAFDRQVRKYISKYMV